MHIWICLVSCLLLNLVQAEQDLDCPDTFQIREDHKRRVFRILDGGKNLGVAINSNYGQFDFYDHEKELRWVNIRDSLHTLSKDGRFLGECIATVTVLSDLRTFKSNRIDLFSDQNKPLAYLDAEGDTRTYVFRDAETDQPLATAIWNWTRIGRWSLSDWNDIQDWSVQIVDRTRLQEKKIPILFLVWTLLKHSQKYGASPREYPFEERPACIFHGLFD
jgi:hypothetical protein